MYVVSKSSKRTEDTRKFAVLRPLQKSSRRFKEFRSKRTSWGIYQTPLGCFAEWWVWKCGRRKSFALSETGLVLKSHILDAIVLFSTSVSPVPFQTARIISDTNAFDATLLFGLDFKPGPYDRVASDWVACIAANVLKQCSHSPRDSSERTSLSYLVRTRSKRRRNSRLKSAEVRQAWNGM